MPLTASPVQAELFGGGSGALLRIPPTAVALKNNQIPHALASWSFNFSLGYGPKRSERYHLLQQRGVSTSRSSKLMLQRESETEAGGIFVLILKHWVLARN